VSRMKITFLQTILAGAVALLAIVWMRAVLFYSLLICTILICSWFLGLLMCLQLNPVPAAVDGLASVRDNQHSLLHTTVVRLVSLLSLSSLCDVSV